MSANLRNAAVFYAIALSLAVAVAIAAPVLGEASLIITMFTPATAAAVLLTILAPEGDFRQTLAGLGLDRAGLKGWPLAIGGPFVIHLAGLAILAATGLAVLALPQMDGPVAKAAIKIVVGLAIGTGFALAEEVGWRGYLLPRLLGLGTLSAMLVSGLLHGLWHLPLLLSTDYYHSSGNPLAVVPLFLATLTLAGIVYGFLRLWTGSVWPVAIAHAAANMAWDLAGSFTQTQSPLVTEYVGGESGLVMIGGLAIFGVVLLRYMGSRRFAPAS